MHQKCDNSEICHFSFEVVIIGWTSASKQFSTKSGCRAFKISSSFILLNIASSLLTFVILSDVYRLEVWKLQ